MHLTITCERGEVPCMTNLKEKLGKNIVFYVEFLPGMENDFKYHADEDGDANESILPWTHSFSYIRRLWSRYTTTTTSGDTRTPMSGDRICIQNKKKSGGSIGYFGLEENDGKSTYYCTTCYHVAYNCDSLLPNDVDKKWDIYHTESENENSKTRRSTFCYKSRKESQTEQMYEEDGALLGPFLKGKFDKSNDIALIEVNADCQDHLTSTNVGQRIATSIEVNRMYYEIEKKEIREPINVEKIGSASGKTEGTLVGIDYCRRKEGGRFHHYKGYSIKGKYQCFAREGDSGSLVKVIKNENNQNEELIIGYHVGINIVPENYNPTGPYVERSFCLNLHESLKAIRNG